MDRDELRTRLGQEMAKRLDLARYRLGLRRWVPRPDGSTASANFFFTPGEVPQILQTIRDRLPGRAGEIVLEADAICLHRLRLLGYNTLDFGPEIDWYRDIVHGTRARRRVWYKIDFLNFSQVGDHKVIWELNRHQHLVTLAKAWLLTGETRYVTELAAQWYSWQRANPYPLGINWASSLEAGFRSLSWLWVRGLLSAAPESEEIKDDSLPLRFTSDLVRSLAIHGRYIERNLSTYFSPNTHLIGEAAALFFIGTLCPQIPDAARWRELGWSTLIAEAARQVLPDGVHFEQSLHYHVYALDFFLHARQLAMRNGIPIPGDFEQTILKMLEVVSALAQASPPEGFGDDDGGRVFDARRNRTEHMTDPLAVGAGIFARPEFKHAAGLTEEAIWLLGPEGLRVFDALNGCPHATGSKSFEAGGIYVMAALSAAGPSTQMAIDAGPQGTGRSGHGHADALSVRCGAGRRWLIDPGTYRYVGDPEERNHYRGTSAHNTMRVDGLDQAIPEGPFAWSKLPNVQVERRVTGATFAFFAGNHTGYNRLPDPVLHRRFMLQISAAAEDPFWLIRDLAEGRDLHQLEVFWHFAADTSIDWSGDAFVASAPAGSTLRTHLTLLGAREAGWSRELTSDYVSPAYGVRLAAPLVRFQATVRLPAECATFILPGVAPPGYTFERLGADARAEQRPVSGYRYQDSIARREFLFAESDDAWTFGAWSSDARLVYASFKSEQLAHLVLVDGSFAEFEGKALALCPRRLQRFEWLKAGDELQTFSSGDDVGPAISRETVRV